MDIVKLCSQIELYALMAQFEYLYKLAAVDPIATNKTEETEIPPGMFSPEDTLQSYKNKMWNMYYKDIYKVHFDRYVKLYMKEGLSEEAAKQKAVEKVQEITTKQNEKSLGSHQTFVNLLKDMGVQPGEKVVAPGSGFGDEQVIAPDLRWHGLEYQKNLVDMSNQRNQQMGLGSTSDVWSFLKVNPDDPLGENWQDKINTFTDTTGHPKALYAKHACGGITDGVLWRSVQSKVPRIFLATCCANRYTEVSWRVLQPKNDDGSPMSFEEYQKLAKLSKRQDDFGKEIVDKIDSMRQDFLERNGYRVERGRTGYGPFIKAWLK